MGESDGFKPYATQGTLSRYEPEIDMPWQLALLCIDLQVLGCREGYGVFESHRRHGVDEASIRSYLKRLDELVIPNVRKLQQAFRATRAEVLHSRIQSMTADGRDRSLEHKRLGLHAPPGSRLAEFLPEVAPQDNEVVINKTASGVFVATNIEYILRNLGVQRLFVCGVYTNECISSAVRSASDLGFDVRLVSDATAAITRELHEATLLITDNRYCKVVTTSQAIAELSRYE